MSWFYNLKTSVKLISSFLLISCIMIFVGFYGMSNLKNMNDTLDDMYDNNLLPVSYLLQAQVDFTDLRVVARDLYIRKGAAERNERIEDYETLRSNIERLVKEFRNTELSDDSRALMGSFDQLWKEYNEEYAKTIAFSQAGKDSEALGIVTGSLADKAEELKQLITSLVQNNIDEADQFSKDGDELYQSSTTITIAIIVTATILCSLFGYVISQIIAKPLNRVVKVVTKVAEGDLRELIDIRTKDEIGRVANATDDMVRNLRRIVGDILGSSQSVSAAAQQISASTEEIAGGSANQASAAQTINELFGELSAAIHSVAQNTETASELSNKTVTIAREGSEVIKSSAESMNAVSSQMSRLEDDSQKIGEIIEVIEDIADQTNLLALNAAIEAARAGEQGRGFAVVADEVRKLAERSGEATKQIAGIIKGMQENTRLSVSAVQESVQFSRNTGESFQQIVTMVNDSGQKVMEIAAASEEQAAQASSVLTAVESISAATEEAAASSEETAATAQSLAELAEELQHSVSIFKFN